MTETERIVRALSSLRVRPMPEEYEIHELIAQALDRENIPYIHEYKLMPGRRIDFISGRTGIEVKKGRPVSAQLRKQLQKYLESDELDAMIVVLQKPCWLPDAICGKPVIVIALNRLWGVALP